MCVVAVGNAFDGMTLYGPFEGCGEAIEWAECNVKDEHWIVVPVMPTGE